MAKQKRSFFERLTGAVHTDDNDYDFDEVEIEKKQPAAYDDLEAEAQLNVDVINAADEIIIKALVAGVHPNELDISITREMVTIRGDRKDKDMFAREDYIQHELFWGAFARTIILPEEVEVEEARASETHGLLVITLPKIDKKRETKLQVKSESAI